MRWLASYVMQGRLQAVFAVTILAVISWNMSLVGILNAAAVGLVTLRRGANEGLITAGLATLGSALLGLVVLGDMAPAFATLAFIWMPTLLVSIVLRVTRSLAAAVQSGLLLGVAVVVAYFIAMPDMVAGWREILETFSKPLVEAELLTSSQRMNLIESLAPWMTGILAAGLYLQLMAGLLMARWWQAALYNPGGFRQEFHSLRLHKTLAYIAAPILVFGFNTEMSGAGLLINYAAVLLVAAYFVQGLAFVHGLMALIGAHGGWLIAMYVLLIVALPNMFGLLFAAGYADAWFDFRARFQAKKDAGDGPID
ncbi:DUF2232 domain-containing protein [Pseudomonadota bacterium]